MAKEHGMMEHKGKSIPKEVKSLADRIRKEQPDKSDEYAYRTAWDIYRSYTAEGKDYPHKSPESGLKREGGGTGQISKEGSVEWAYTPFWLGFMKQAAIKIPKIVPKMPKMPSPGAADNLPLGVQRMSTAAKEAVKPPKTIKPAPEPLNYQKMNEITRKPASTLTYGSRGAESYTPPSKI